MDETIPRMSPTELNAWLDNIRARAEVLLAEMIAENEDTKRRLMDIEKARKEAITTDFPHKTQV